MYARTARDILRASDLKSYEFKDPPKTVTSNYQDWWCIRHHTVIINMMLLLKTCFFHTKSHVPSNYPQFPVISRAASSASHTTQLHEQTLRSYSSTPPALFPGWSDKGEGHVILSAGPLVLFPLAPFHTAVCAQMAPPEPEPPAVSLISMNREPGTGNVTTSTRKRNTANTFPPPETRSGPEHATYRIQGHCKPLEQEGRDGPYRLL